MTFLAHSHFLTVHHHEGAVQSELNIMTTAVIAN